MHTRSNRLPWLLVLLAALLAACAALPEVAEIPRQQLEAALARRFPYEARPAGLFTASVGLPRLQLRPDENRLRLELAIEASDRLLRRSGRGELAVSFGLRYEPSDATIRAAGVRVEQLALHGLPEGWREPLQLAGALVAEGMLDGMVLYTLRPEDRARLQGRLPGSLRVTPRGVQVELLPPPASAR